MNRKSNAQQAVRDWIVSVTSTYPVGDPANFQLLGDYYGIVIALVVCDWT